MVVFIILFALAAAGLGVGAYLYMKQKSDLNEKIEDRDKELDDKEDEISELSENVATLEGEKTDLESQKADLEQSVSSKNSEIDKLNTDLATAKKERDEYKGQVDISAKELSDAYAKIKGLKPPTNDYFSTKNVVILKPGESETIKVSVRVSGNVSVTFNADKKNPPTTAKWDSSWTSDANLHTNSITFTAGNKADMTVFTFTNDKTADTFQILVITLA